MATTAQTPTAHPAPATPSPDAGDAQPPTAGWMQTTLAAVVQAASDQQGRQADQPHRAAAQALQARNAHD